MNAITILVTKMAAYAGLIGLVAGAAGLLAQMLVVAFGGQESPALVTAFGALAGTSVTSLGVLAGVVWTRGPKREEP